MDIQSLILSLLAVAFLSVVIMYACDSFDEAASYLGRHMSPGIKGATINAIGSSMPELLTTLVFLFFFHDLDGFSAGVATAAGSAIFNGLVIPAACILLVTTIGVKQADGSRKKIQYIQVNRHTIVRDGFWLIIGELLLIYFLGDYHLTWVAGASLLLIYIGYLIHLMRDNKKYAHLNEDSEEEDEEEEEKNKGALMSLLTLDFHHLFFKSQELNNFRAWTVLSAAIVVLSIACWGLAEAVVKAADALDVPVYFTAVVLAAAATSVPDTILSLKDAAKGQYDDAVSNAIGSNIFDIAVSLGFPLLLYSLLFGTVELSHATGESASDVQELRIILLVISILLIAALWLRWNKIGKGVGLFLMAMYVAWMVWILGAAFNWF